MSGGTFVRPQTSIEAFDDPDQKEVVRQMRNRLDTLEAVTGMTGAVKQGRSAQVPPRATLTISTNIATAPGHFFVEIQNPEYSGVNPQNPNVTPIIHQLESSTTPDFSTDVKTWPPGVQTTYTITEFGSSRRYFQARSSIDGKNWNQPVPVGPFQS